MDVKISRVYAAPHSTDEQGRVWHRSLSGMDFATARVGWAVGSTQILHTRDGGKTWANQYGGSGGCQYLNSHRVFAVSAKVCWIVAIYSATDVRCCYTRDGGETWRGKEIEAAAYPNDIFFVGPERGWLVSDDGRLPAGAGQVHLTEDGGESWRPLGVRIEGKPTKVRFHDARKGWLIEHHVSKDGGKTYSRLHTSDDGGRGWRVCARFNRRISDLFVLDESRLYLAGEAGFIAESVDGGHEWRRVAIRSRAFINAIRLHDGTGIALGDHGTLLLSKDGGQTWDKVSAKPEEGNFINAHFETRRSGTLVSSNSLYSFSLEI